MSGRNKCYEEKLTCKGMENDEGVIVDNVVKRQAL